MDLSPLSNSSDRLGQSSSLAPEFAAMAPLCAIFRRFLRTRDLKYTPERADVLNAIIARAGGFEAELLMADMRARN